MHEISVKTGLLTIVVSCYSQAGDGGAGHFVKMVHNGIEYGDMQLISEAYFLLTKYLHLTAAEASKVSLL